MGVFPRSFLFPALAALSMAAGAEDFSNPRTAPSAADAGLRDEKGRTQSEISAAYEREWAASAKRDAEECLAFLRNERRCLVTAGEFNRYLAGDARWTDAIGDSGSAAEGILQARRSVLNSLLAERYSEILAASPRGDGLLAEEAWRTHLSEIASAFGRERLRASYRRHAALFAPQREVQAVYLAATDSVYLDSLVRYMLTAARKTAGAPKDSARGGCGFEAHWERLLPQEVPPEFAGAAAGLEVGEVSGLRRSRFGWFVAAATRVTEIPGKSFEEALPLLLYLPETPGKAVSSATPEGGPAAFRPEGPGKKTPEDGDLPLRVWLLPLLAPGNGGKAPRPDWPDTARVNALRLRLSDLPFGVR
jgi:hypothetical protein